MKTLLLSGLSVLSAIIILFDFLLSTIGLKKGFSEGNPFLLMMSSYFNITIVEVLIVNSIISFCCVVIIFLSLHYLYEKNFQHIFDMLMLFFIVSLIYRVYVVFEWVMVLIWL